ncbi:MAG: T9SS type A sorting domain-containing protein, partial [Bacteroidales bacterium]|nr:T9SS type A sorting domain-containing protein [Bacteroidales bacterium]
TVTPSDTTVVVGSDVTLNIRPNDGFHISQLEIDGNIVIDYASSEIVFTNVNSDHHIKISFFPNSVEENMFANLSIYPNPNNGQFTVSSDDFDGDVTFQIFSVSGAMMDERMVNGEKTVSFDKSLPAGTYFLRIIAGEKVATRKLVVE